MTPTHSISRRSFLASVGGATAAGGALLAVSCRAGGAPAAQVAAGDSDFAAPIPTGDTFQSDPPPGRRTGLNDRDSGEAFDLPNYGTGRAVREVRAERCSEIRQRIARYESMPRTAERDRRITTLRPYPERWRCG
jgi:hypothetical protein